MTILETVIAEMKACAEDFDTREGRHLLERSGADAERFIQERLAKAAINAVANALGNSLNSHLIEMKPNYDDSITGFNEAWDVMRKALQ